jgi:hypothetical protein
MGTIESPLGSKSPGILIQQLFCVDSIAGRGAAAEGVPDVAANAEPATGYVICVDGQDAVVGGTSSDFSWLARIMLP